MRLMITTLGRLESQTTLVGLPKSIQRRITLVVQEHELEQHRERWGEHCAGVEALPPHVRTLGATRQFLVEHHRGQKIVMMDDDLTFYVRPDRGDWRLRMPRPDQMEEMFFEVEAKLDEYAHVGISGREGNNRVLEYGSECARYMRMLCYNTARFPLSVRCDRLDGVSDFDANLQLLRHGMPSYIFSRYAQGQDETQAAGGCSLTRTHDSHAAEILLLAELHPHQVRVVEKHNKTGGEFGHRTEAVISWRGALREGTLMLAAAAEAERLAATAAMQETEA